MVVTKKNYTLQVGETLRKDVEDCEDGSANPLRK